MNLNELPAVLDTFGVLLNNLFQLDNGTWRASVRDKKNSLAFEFGDGLTPSDAVNDALRKHKAGAGQPVRRNQPRVAAQKISPAISGSALLAQLGLLKS